MISQFFILSPRGDTIILRDFLNNVPKVNFLALLLHLASADCEQPDIGSDITVSTKSWQGLRFTVSCRAPPRCSSGS